MEINLRKKFYLYKHFYMKDAKEVIFYIGKGQGERVFSTTRNRYWNEIIDSLKGVYNLGIVKYFDNEEECLLEEKRLQQYYWDKGECRGCADLYEINRLAEIKKKKRDYYIEISNRFREDKSNYYFLCRDEYFKKTSYSDVKTKRKFEEYKTDIYKYVDDIKFVLYVFSKSECKYEKKNDDSMYLRLNDSYCFAISRMSRKRRKSDRTENKVNLSKEDFSSMIEEFNNRSNG